MRVFVFVADLKHGLPTLALAGLTRPQDAAREIVELEDAFAMTATDWREMIGDMETMVRNMAEGRAPSAGIGPDVPVAPKPEKLPPIGDQPESGDKAALARALDRFGPKKAPPVEQLAEEGDPDAWRRGLEDISF